MTFFPTHLILFSGTKAMSTELSPSMSSWNWTTLQATTQSLDLKTTTTTSSTTTTTTATTTTTFTTVRGSTSTTKPGTKEQKTSKSLDEKYYWFIILYLSAFCMFLTVTVLCCWVCQLVTLKKYFLHQNNQVHDLPLNKKSEVALTRINI